MTTACWQLGHSFSQLLDRLFVCTIPACCGLFSSASGHCGATFAHACMLPCLLYAISQAKCLRQLRHGSTENGNFKISQKTHAAVFTTVFMSSRYHQAMEPPQRSDDSRVQVQEAAWFHWYVSHPQQSSAWPQNGWSHGRRASQDQEARGGQLHCN